jgi:hypothetical protein
MSRIVLSVWCQVANPFEQRCLFDVESLKGSTRSALQHIEGFFCSSLAKQWIGETMTGECMQIALVQFAAEVRSTYETSEIGVDRVFVPTNERCVIGTYADAVEVSEFHEGNVPLWDDNSSWQERTFRAGAQCKFVPQAKHRSTRLSVVNYVSRHAPTLELPVRIDKER